MDVTTKPGDDFMKYAGGIWLQKNPVPAKETRWGAFNILRDFNIKAVRDILEGAAADKKPPQVPLKNELATSTPPVWIALPLKRPALLLCNPTTHGLALCKTPALCWMKLPTSV